MKNLKFAVAVIACSVANVAMATPTPSTFANLQSAAPSATTGQSAKSWDNSLAGYNTTNGTDYGNTLTFNQTSGRAGTVTLSAFGTTSLTGNIATGYIANYGNTGCGSKVAPKPCGFGITSRSAGELDSNHKPDATSPTWQHAIDNTTAYEAMMLTFSNSVTLNSVNIGFVGADGDATVLEYVGGGLPASVIGKTFTQLVASGGGWAVVANPTFTAQSSTAISGGVASKYWMIGAYMPLNGGTADASPDSFKLTGFVATAVPEPGSIALFGIAGAALFGSRVRRKRAA